MKQLICTASSEDEKPHEFETTLRCTVRCHLKNYRAVVWSSKKVAAAKSDDCFYNLYGMTKAILTGCPLNHTDGKYKDS